MWSRVLAEAPQYQQGGPRHTVERGSTVSPFASRPRPATVIAIPLSEGRPWPSRELF